jgi:sterol desaturase/sphingolipid hydroxylase (fatty acid hydroxylase superfamily)
VIDALSLPLAFATGVATWSFAEYAMHNWVGHMTKGKTEFSKEHLAHHSKTTYFASPMKKALMAAPIIAAALGVSALLVGLLHGAVFTSGFAAFYLLYEVLHRRTHTHAPWEPFGRWARRHHFHHHFCNPKSNHGVTSPIWDLVFRTYERPSVIAIPPRQADGVTWLFDPETGEVIDAYADDYRLHRRPVLTA